MTIIKDADLDSAIRKYAKDNDVSHLDIIKVLLCAYGTMCGYWTKVNPGLEGEIDFLNDVAKEFEGDPNLKGLLLYLHFANILLDTVEEAAE